MTARHSEKTDKKKKEGGRAICPPRKRRREKPKQGTSGGRGRGEGGTRSRSAERKRVQKGRILELSLILNCLIGSEYFTSETNGTGRHRNGYCNREKR